MKSLVKLALGSAALLLAGAAWAQAPVSEYSVTPLRIAKKQLPIFPREVTRMGVRDGMAQVAVGVDATGRIDDLFITACTLPEFGEATVAALKHWRFEPARLNGRPVPASTVVTVDYQTDGVAIVSLNGNEYLLSLLCRSLLPGRGYAVKGIHELDHPPVAITAPAPVFPQELAQRAHGDVAVRFYIDETGKPRLVAADAGSDPELAALAVSAVSQWRFEVPTADGQPARVRAMQVFSFRPITAAASSKG